MYWFQLQVAPIIGRLTFAQNEMSSRCGIEWVRREKKRYRENFKESVRPTDDERRECGRLFRNGNDMDCADIGSVCGITLNGWKCTWAKVLIAFRCAIAALMLVLGTLGSAHANEPLNDLRTAAPALYKLYQSYPSYHKDLGDYANKQGYRRPVENLATVVHEIIHVDSFSHQGYFVDGVYYEPHVRADAWPSLTNEQVRPYLLGDERGVIYQLYALNTPRNHLGNLVDEINAYGHVLPFVCRMEPESTEKQVKNLIGFLQLAEGYLRVLRTAMPKEYAAFTKSVEARGAFTLIVQRAWKALRECGVSEQSIPVQEAAWLMGRPR